MKTGDWLSITQYSEKWETQCWGWNEILHEVLTMGCNILAVQKKNPSRIQYKHIWSNIWTLCNKCNKWKPEKLFKICEIDPKTGWRMTDLILYTKTDIHTFIYACMQHTQWGRGSCSLLKSWHDYLRSLRQRKTFCSGSRTLFLWHHLCWDDPCQKYMEMSSTAVTLHSLKELRMKDFLCSYQSYMVNLTRSHMDGNLRDRKKELVCPEERSFWHWIKSMKFPLCNNHGLNLDLEIDKLIPFWVCIFLDDFGAQLKQNKIWSHKIIIIITKPLLFLLNMKYLFPSKADFQIWIHQVFPVSIPSKDLFHSMNKGIIHCNIKQFLNSRFLNGCVCIAVQGMQ